MIRAVLNDEKGIEIGDALDFPSGMLPSIDDQEFFCMRFIDPYGDTVFNHLQVPTVLKDIECLKARELTHEERGIVRDLEALCHLCLDEPHIYLKFIGD